MSAVTTTLGRDWPEQSGTVGVCATTVDATIVSRTKTDFTIGAAGIFNSMRDCFERCRQHPKQELIAGYVWISEHQIDVVHSRRRLQHRAKLYRRESRGGRDCRGPAQQRTRRRIEMHFDLATPRLGLSRSDRGECDPADASEADLLQRD